MSEGPTLSPGPQSQGPLSPGTELRRVWRGLRLILGWNSEGFAHFSTGRGGFWRSFLAALLLLPVWALLQYDELRVGHIHIAHPRRFAAIELGGYLLSWLIYPLVAALVARWFGRWRHFYHAMTVTNWFQLVQIPIWPLLRLAADVNVPADTLFLLWIAAHGTILAYSIYITRHTLGLPGGSTTALVVIGFLLDILTGGLIDRAAGLVPW